MLGGIDGLVTPDVLWSTLQVSWTCLCFAMGLLKGYLMCKTAFLIEWSYFLIKELTLWATKKTLIEKKCIVSFT